MTEETKATDAVAQASEMTPTSKDQTKQFSATSEMVESHDQNDGVQNKTTEVKLEEKVQASTSNQSAQVTPRKKRVRTRAKRQTTVEQRQSGRSNQSGRSGNSSTGSTRDRVRNLRKIPPKIKQAEVVLKKDTVVHLDSRTSTRVMRIHDDARSKCVVTVNVTIHSQHAQRLLERNFQYVSWSADKIAEYIQRNLRNEKIVQFEEVVDQESTKISQKLDEGIAFFSEHVRNLESNLKMSSHYTCPVEYELPIESNSACRFVRLVMQFDQLCHLLDVLTISDQFGDGANVKLATEIRKWRGIVQGMTNLIIGTQREARQLITTNQFPTKESATNAQALIEAAKVAEEEEKAFSSDAEITPKVDDAVVVDKVKNLAQTNTSDKGESLKTEVPSKADSTDVPKEIPQGKLPVHLTADFCDEGLGDYLMSS